MLTSLPRASLLEMLAPLDLDFNNVDSMSINRDEIAVKLLARDADGRLQVGPSGQSALYEHVTIRLVDEEA